MTLKVTLDQYVCYFHHSRHSLTLRKNLFTTWDVTLKNSYDPTFSNFTKDKIKSINILHECKKIKKC